MDENRENFRQVCHFYDTRFKSDIYQILPGEYLASKKGSIIYTVLGSCVAACIMDPVLKVGGMNHFMLPVPSFQDGRDSWGESARYGSFAMELLINDIMKLGGERSRLEVKLFGGAHLWDAANKVGETNAEWAIEYLKIEGIKLITSDVGDMYPRKVYFFTDSGRVLMKKIKNLKNGTILEREDAYQKHLDWQKSLHKGQETNIEFFKKLGR